MIARIKSIHKILLFFLVLYNLTTHSQIITVKQDGTGDFITIQAAVDSVNDGDTIIVYQGIYFENVYLENKNITIGGVYLLTGNTSHIKQTVIDGNNNGSCIEIRNCQSLLNIIGLTLIHGSGTWSGAVSGGGLFIKYSNVEVISCIIHDNKVTGTGGGIYCHESEVFLSNTTIAHNHAYRSGGGLIVNNSNVEFDSVNPCSIYENYAAKGTDIQKSTDEPLHVILDTFTVINPDYYYMVSFYGSAYPDDDITYEINAGKIQTVNQDLFVSPFGSNDNNGLSPEEPLKDIWYALLKMESDSLQPDTIHIENGVYLQSTGEKYPLSLKKYVSLKGTFRDSTILDAEDEIYLLNGIVFADNYQVSDLTIRNGNGDDHSSYGMGAIILFENHNATFKDLLFTSNAAGVNSCGAVAQSNNVTFINVDFTYNIGGKAIRSGTGNIVPRFSDTVTFINCRFFNNHPDYSTPDEGFGGGATVLCTPSYPDSMNAIFYNCLFYGNKSKIYQANWAGSTAFSVGEGGQAFLINCTLADNDSDNPSGANIGVTYNSDLHIYNSIMYNNYPAEFYMFTDPELGDCDLVIDYSLVDGGEEGIRILSPANNVYYGLRNINTDPMWDTTNFYPYGLSPGSPCIDAGTLDLPEGIELPETDLAGNPRVHGTSVDMGAYEFGPWVSVPYYPQIMERTSALEVSPNPFRYNTKINYSSIEGGHICMRVYDARGNHVSTLMDVNGAGGSGTIYWDGKDDHGHELGEGIYVISLMVNGTVMDAVRVVRR
ncbi:MAG: choice-of-anchor Q domain-containing protein [Bacteroidota bacterium]|nr:choice-of-anchor Q domain-containing protein [Bacteroidota bacterium]